MDVHFERIAMDIVEPLRKSQAGHRFILVICDYATQYPEAIFLRSVEARHMADALVGFLSRVEIPREVLTDQGTNFMSWLMGELYRMLWVKTIRTNLYNPQTGGLLQPDTKAMLRRTTQEEKDWDQLLLYILFAYREVVQVSTGIRPSSSCKADK